MEETIYTATQEALTALGASDVSFAVEWPTDSSHGDYSVNAALSASKMLGKNPREVAELLVPMLTESLEGLVSRIDIAGPGFINFYASSEVVQDSLNKAAASSTLWGRGGAHEGARIIIEYSCPNPFKEMHIGHLMSTVIGEAMSRLMEYSGAHVTRDSYGGDVGPHIAKALWALQQRGTTQPESAKEIQAAYTHGARAYEESETAKAEIDLLNQAIYAGTNEEVMELWRHGKDVSLEAFRTIYRALGTHFDYYFFESETAPIGMRIVADGLAAGVFEESEGAVIYNGEKKGLHTLVFVTSRGTPTYEAKDIGLAFLKEERVESDQSYIVTAAEQVGHFKVFLAALSEIAPLLAAKTTHIPHGFMRLTSGKMSSRQGTIITAESLLEEVITRASEKNADPIIAQQVAVGALKYMILRSSPGSDIIFDIEKSLSLEGDSGPYLQYALVRATSILAQVEGKTEHTSSSTETPSLFARLITRFPEVVARAERLRAPHTLTHYLTQLASEWNSFYAQERILGSEEEASKILLVHAFVTTMQNGLMVLGIPTPEKM